MQGWYRSNGLLHTRVTLGHRHASSRVRRCTAIADSAYSWGGPQPQRIWEHALKCIIVITGPVGTGPVYHLWDRYAQNLRVTQGAPADLDPVHKRTEAVDKSVHWVLSGSRPHAVVRGLVHPVGTFMIHVQDWYDR